MEEAAGVPRPHEAYGSLGEWPLGHPRPCLQAWKSKLPQALGLWHQWAPSVQKEEQALYLGIRLPQGLEGKERGGAGLQVAGWGGAARQGSVREGSPARAHTHGSTRLGLRRGDARYLDTGCRQVPEIDWVLICM